MVLDATWYMNFFFFKNESRGVKFENSIAGEENSGKKMKGWRDWIDSIFADFGEAYVWTPVWVMDLYYLASVPV